MEIVCHPYRISLRLFFLSCSLFTPMQHSGQTWPREIFLTQHAITLCLAFSMPWPGALIIRYCWYCASWIHKLIKLVGMIQFSDHWKSLWCVFMCMCESSLTNLISDRWNSYSQAQLCFTPPAGGHFSSCQYCKWNQRLWQGSAKRIEKIGVNGE